VIRDQVEHNLRFSGQVLRYHTWPVIRQQSVGEHTWQVMRIYYQLFGPPPTPVWEAMLLHDAPEVQTGDIPFGAKVRNPALRAANEESEERWMKRMKLQWPQLTDVQHWAMKVCDLLEMYEYGLSERRMGNQYAEPIITGVAESISEMLRSYPSYSSKITRWMENA
jgi:hypothetical protein